MDNTNAKSADSVHIEDSASENNIKDAAGPKQRMGDVKLLHNNGETVLVPTPSPDPNGKITTKPQAPHLKPQPKSNQHHPPQTPSTYPHSENGPSSSSSPPTAAPPSY
jgi:hypothetical protein